MYKKIALATFMCLFTSVASAEMKIVVLDSVRAILESEEAKVLIQAAEAELEVDNEKFRGMAEKGQGLQEKLTKDGEVLSATEKRQLQKEIEDLNIELQFTQQKLQKAVQDKRQEILVALKPQFDKVLQDLISVEGYDMIVSPQALLYTNQKNDITRRVTERMNEQKD